MLALHSGCAGPEEIPDAGAGFPRTEEGEPLLDGKLRLVSVTPPLRGREAEFVVLNVSDQVLQDLTAVILFYSPSPAGAVEQRESEVRDLRFSVFRDEEFTIRVKPTRGDVLGWELEIFPGATLAREGDTPGTKFLEGMLECVGVKNRLTHMKRSLSFEVENLTGTRLDLLKYKVELVKQGRSVWSTEWIPLPDIAPRARAVITPDVTKVDYGAAEAVLRIRRGLF
jgi:hypothetical protein